MIFRGIKVKDSIQIGERHWRTVSWVADIEAWETPEQKTTEAVNRLENWFHETSLQNNTEPTTKEEQEILQKPVEERWINAINECRNITELSEFQYLERSSNPIIKQAYENKRKELTP